MNPVKFFIISVIIVLILSAFAVVILNSIILQPTSVVCYAPNSTVVFENANVERIDGNIFYLENGTAVQVLEGTCVAKYE